MTTTRDQPADPATSTEMTWTMPKRTDLMNLASLCFSVAVMVAIALVAGWAAQAAAPTAFGQTADRAVTDNR